MPTLPTPPTRMRQLVHASSPPSSLTSPVSEILFVTWDGGGNVPPALALACELQVRGHTVRFLGHARQRDSLRAAGFEVVGNRHARSFSALEPQSPLAMMAAFGDRGMGKDLLAAVAERPADMVVVDCLCSAP